METFPCDICGKAVKIGEGYKLELSRNKHYNVCGVCINQYAICGCGRHVDPGEAVCWHCMAERELAEGASEVAAEYRALTDWIKAC